MTCRKKSKRLWPMVTLLMMIGLGYHQCPPLCLYYTDLTKDMEMNRPGKNGYRTPASKKQKREEAKVCKEILFLHLY